LASDPIPARPRPGRLLVGWSAAALGLLTLDTALAQSQSERSGWWRRPAPREELRRPDPADEAARLYAGARADLDAAQPQAAQRKLELLVARHPGSPLADVARRDLQRLYGAITTPPAATPAAAAGGPEPSLLEQSPRTAGTAAAPMTAQDARLQAAADDLRQRAGDRIFFAEQSDDIGPRAHVALQMQADWLSRHPTIAVTLEGHADEFGGAELNRRIALQRAQAVRTRLIDLGVGPERITIVSQGREQPVADCPERSCAEQNRRVVTMISRAPVGLAGGVTSAVGVAGVRP
jgi:peptidoglycan-associated lipoprotein